MNIAPDIVNETAIKGLPKLEPIPGTRLKRLIEDFWFYSAKLKCWKLIPKGFVYDEESTPWRGENPIAGLVHDFLSRSGSGCDSKILAARVYCEFQYYEDSLIKRPWYSMVWDKAWRILKSSTVIVAPGYWQKYSINATCEDMM